MKSEAETFPEKGRKGSVFGHHWISSANLLLSLREGGKGKVGWIGFLVSLDESMKMNSRMAVFLIVFRNKP